MLCAVRLAELCSRREICLHCNLEAAPEGLAHLQPHQVSVSVTASAVVEFLQVCKQTTHTHTHTCLSEAYLIPCCSLRESNQFRSNSGEKLNEFNIITHHPQIGLKG